MGNKLSKSNAVNSVDDFDTIDQSQPQTQTKSPSQAQSQSQTADHRGRYRVENTNTANQSNGENSPQLGTGSVDANVQLFEKLNQMHSDITLLLSKIDTVDAPSISKNFEKHATVRHISQWITEWKHSGITCPPPQLDVEKLNIVLDYVSKTKSEYDIFTSLLEEERDEELRKFLNDELNPTKSQDRPKFTLTAVANAVRFSHRMSKSVKGRQAASYDIPAVLTKYLPEINSYSFNIFDFERDCGGEKVLYHMALLAFKHYNLLDKFPIPSERLNELLLHSNSRYQKNPYHSETHVADVLQTVLFFLNGDRIKNIFSDLDILAIILAVIFHDIEHPGVSNTFEQKTLTERAIRYNDVSILENHHCSTAFQILMDEKFGIMDFFNDNQKAYLRKAIIFMILGTDISQHFSSVNTLKETILKSFEPNQEEHVLLIMKMIVKAADVSNPTKPLPVSSLWADRITEEFFQQGDREKKLGLSVSAFCDRENPAKAKSQIGFMQYIVQPLYSILSEFDPSLGITVTAMQDNLKYWQSQTA